MHFRRHGRLATMAALIAVVGLSGCDRSSTDPVDDHGEPVAAEVFNRDTGELLAETHGTGAAIHWDGSIPTLAVGGGIEVDVVFLDEVGNAIPLGGGEYEVRARLANGAPEGVIGIVNHVDHIDIEGVGEGSTQIVFMLWHGGHADWETPELEISVVPIVGSIPTLRR
jgi:hypothetical protein